MKTTLGQVRFFGTCEHSKNIHILGPKCWPFPIRIHAIPFFYNVFHLCLVITFEFFKSS